MEDKNKTYSDGWDPTEYEIYTKEETEKESAEIPLNTGEDEVLPKKRKSKKSKRKAVTTAVAVIILIAALACGYFFLKDRVLPGENNSGGGSSPIIKSSVRVTFPEGYTVYQMAQLLQENKVCSAEDFMKAADTPVDGIEINNADERVFLLEGYLFPDTYDFYIGEDAQSVVKRFIKNYNSKVGEATKQKARQLGYTMDEMLTLASIIQKECDKDIAECQNVSSVFHNRLKQSKNSYLGSDVTYFYLKNMAEHLGGSESEEFDRYLLNYYTYSPYRKGLPAGPICNPGLKAIEAAVSPANTNYIYFLTDASGEKFYYAETYEQHLKNGKEAGIMN